MEATESAPPPLPFSLVHRLHRVEPPKCATDDLVEGKVGRGIDRAEIAKGRGYIIAVRATIRHIIEGMNCRVR